MSSTNLDPKLQQQHNNFMANLGTITYGNNTASSASLPVLPLSSFSSPSDSLYSPITSGGSVFTNLYDSCQNATNQGYRMTGDFFTDYFSMTMADLYTGRQQLGAILASTPTSNAQQLSQSQQQNPQKPINTINKYVAFDNLTANDNEKLKKLQDKGEEIAKKEAELKSSRAGGAEKDKINEEVIRLKEEFYQLEKEYCDGKQLSNILGKNKYKFYTNLSDVEIRGIKTANETIKKLKDELAAAKKELEDKKAGDKQKHADFVKQNGRWPTQNEMYTEEEKQARLALENDIKELEQKITGEIELLDGYVKKAAKGTDVQYYHTYKNANFERITTSGSSSSAKTGNSDASSDAVEKINITDANGNINLETAKDELRQLASTDTYEKANIELVENFISKQGVLENLDKNPKAFFEAVVAEDNNGRLFVGEQKDKNRIANLDLLMEFYDRVKGNEGAFKEDYKKLYDVAKPHSAIKGLKSTIDLVGGLRDERKKSESSSSSRSSSKSSSESVDTETASKQTKKLAQTIRLNGITAQDLSTNPNLVNKEMVANASESEKKALISALKKAPEPVQKEVLAVLEVDKVEDIANLSSKSQKMTKDEANAILNGFIAEFNSKAGDIGKDTCPNFDKYVEILTSAGENVRNNFFAKIAEKENPYWSRKTLMALGDKNYRECDMNSFVKRAQDLMAKKPDDDPNYSYKDFIDSRKTDDAHKWFEKKIKSGNVDDWTEPGSIDELFVHLTSADDEPIEEFIKAIWQGKKGRNYYWIKRTLCALGVTETEFEDNRYVDMKHYTRFILDKVRNPGTKKWTEDDFEEVKLTPEEANNIVYDWGNKLKDTNNHGDVKSDLMDWSNPKIREVILLADDWALTNFAKGATDGGDSEEVSGMLFSCLTKMLKDKNRALRWAPNEELKTPDQISADERAEYSRKYDPDHYEASSHESAFDETDEDQLLKCLKHLRDELRKQDQAEAK